METMEMVSLREQGYKITQIAEMAGISFQAVGKRLKRYNQGIPPTRRGKKLNIEKIVYQGFYDWFLENPLESVQSLLRKMHSETTHGNNAKMRFFLYGEKNTWFTVPQIKKMCEIIGKPFEEVFKERENNDR